PVGFCRGDEINQRIHICKLLYICVYDSIPMDTTIKIKDKTRTKLENFKIYSKETYNDVIERLMRTAQDDDLDPQTVRNLRKSLDDMEKGKTYSLEQVEKELDI